MHAFPIRSDADLARALDLVDSLWDAAPDSHESDTLDVMAELIQHYEAKGLWRALPPPNPLALIEFKLSELKISQRELGRRLGWSSGRVSEVLSGKRRLTLAMVRDLERVLGLDPGLLIVGRSPGQEGGVWVQLPADLVAAAQRARFTGLDSLQRLVEDAVTSTLCATDLTSISSTQERSIGPASNADSDRPYLTLVDTRRAA